MNRPSSTLFNALVFLSLSYIPPSLNLFPSLHPVPSLTSACLCFSAYLLIFFFENSMFSLLGVARNNICIHFFFERRVARATRHHMRQSVVAWRVLSILSFLRSLIPWLLHLFISSHKYLSIHHIHLSIQHTILPCIH